MLKYVKGSLFDAKEALIAHGVNCRGGFGSGVAGQMAQKYPKAKEMYLEKFNYEGWKLGQTQIFQVLDGKYIANCATQDEYYPRDRCHADYDAIEEAMDTLKSFAKLHNLGIAIPKIGAGLAGGDWTKISAILEDVFDDYDVTVYHLD